MNLITATVGIMHGKLVKISGDVIRGTRISVPTVISFGRRSKASIALLRGRVIIIYVPTSFSVVANFTTDLALWTRPLASGGRIFL
jgi:hypothetical protein